MVDDVVKRSGEMPALHQRFDVAPVDGDEQQSGLVAFIKREDS